MASPGRKPRPPGVKLFPVIEDLFRLQEEAGMTDGQLLNLAGYDVAVLRQIRKRGQPSLRTLIDLAQVFGYEVRLVPSGEKALELPGVRNLRMSLEVLGYRLKSEKIE